ncbi:MAG: ABC transporter substrate-binding protein [Candidatus Omnitrophica bacterium]|nr:ABC transporter substrate-binding protein [Candidatus Omnitrophota bacterium]
MKKLVAVGLITLCSCWFCAEAGTAETPALQKRIGLLLWSDEPRYKEAAEGMLARFKEEGFSGVDLDVRTESALGNKVKAMKIAQSFAQEKRDLYAGFGTNAVAALSTEIKDRPIVFSVVYDPVGSGLVANLNSSGNNITGVRNYFPMSEVIGRLQQIRPVHHLAVLYTPGQKNSESQFRDVQKAEAEKNIRVLPVLLANANDVQTVMPYLKGKVEAVFLTGSGVVGDAVEQIVAAAAREDIVTVSSSVDYAAKGVILCAGANAHEAGTTAAKQAIMILKGAKPAGIPIEGPEKLEILLNLKTVGMMKGVQIPDGLKKEATKIFE